MNVKKKPVTFFKNSINISMGAIRYSCPIRLVPTYILPAICGSFIPLTSQLRTWSLKRKPPLSE